MDNTQSVIDADAAQLKALGHCARFDRTMSNWGASRSVFPIHRRSSVTTRLSARPSRRAGTRSRRRSRSRRSGSFASATWPRTPPRSARTCNAGCASSPASRSSGRRGGRSASSARSISRRPGEPVAGAQAPGSVGGIAAARLQENGVIARNMQDARALCSPLTITTVEVDLLMDRVGDVLDGVTSDGVAVGR
jgi:hypothetical protein